MGIIMSTLKRNLDLIVLLVGLALIIGWLLSYLNHSMQYQRSMVRSCVADGNKEYQCAAMFEYGTIFPVPK